MAEPQWPRNFEHEACILAHKIRDLSKQCFSRHSPVIDTFLSCRNPIPLSRGSSMFLYQSDDSAPVLLNGQVLYRAEQPACDPGVSVYGGTEIQSPGTGVKSRALQMNQVPPTGVACSPVIVHRCGEMEQGLVPIPYRPRRPRPFLRRLRKLQRHQYPG